MGKLFAIISAIIMVICYGKIEACSESNFMVDWGQIGEIRQLSDASIGGPGRPYVVFTITSKADDWFGFLTNDDIGKQRLAMLLTAKANGDYVSFYIGSAPAWPFSVDGGSGRVAHPVTQFRVK